MVVQELPRHKGQRKKLVELLIHKGIRDAAVLKAIGAIPRHLFLDSSFEDFAYQDKAFPIAADQTISQPYTVAYQSQLLEVQPGRKYLEIGTGSGYQSAVLAAMGAKVYSVERQKDLHDFARNILRKLQWPVQLSYGDGYKGLPQHAPFDGIIVTAGAPFIPEALPHQLAPFGKLVIPVGQNSQKMLRIIRQPDGRLLQEEHGDFRFVPLLQDRAGQGKS